MLAPGRDCKPQPDRCVFVAPRLRGVLGERSPDVWIAPRPCGFTVALAERGDADESILRHRDSRSAVRVLAVLYPCLTALAVIATGNHFVLDLVGGLVAMGLAVLIVEASAAPAAGLAERLRVSTQGLRS